MNIDECLLWIHGLHKFGKKSGLDNIRFMLECLGNPQEKLRFVHVAGTNGKGSVCSYLSSIFTRAGYKTGLFISPYIERFHERIQIDQREISDADLIRFTARVQACMETLNARGIYPISFEVIMAIAFLYFAEQSCDIVVLETGVGGLLDCTNVIEHPEVCVITEIGLDHTKYLGDTVEKIAAQKAGILKPGSPAVLYPKQDARARDVVEKIAEAIGVPVYTPDLSTLSVTSSGLSGSVFDIDTQKDLHIRLVGEHQIYNALTAIEAIRRLPDRWQVSEQAILSGLKAARWKCRFEVFWKHPLFVLDGAHNLDGMRAFAHTAKRLLSKKRLVCVVGMLNDKDYQAALLEIGTLPDVLIVTSVPSERQKDVESVFSYAKTVCQTVRLEPDPCQAIRIAAQLCGPEGAVLVCGSLYLCGYVRGFVENFLGV